MSLVGVVTISISPLSGNSSSTTFFTMLAMSAIEWFWKPMLKISPWIFSCGASSIRR